MISSKMNDNQASQPEEIPIYWLQPWTWDIAISDDNGNREIESKDICWQDISRLIP